MLSVLALLISAKPERVTLDIDGLKRTALVFAPTVASGHPPVVFAWHGHGGNSRYSSRAYDFQTAWPEAVVVYPEGLPIAGRTDPNGLKNGWNMIPGPRNRDLLFFDALYAKVQGDTHFDIARCFCMGHSNGGGFCYTLWSGRADKFKAFAPCSAGGARMVREPKAAFIMIGTNDLVVSPDSQRISIALIKKLNGATGSPKKLNDNLERFRGVQQTLVWTHANGHTFQGVAVPAMVDFFKSLE